MKPVVLAGGSGSRLWPKSRAALPKQFLALTSEQTMLQETLQRLDGSSAANPIVICNDAHRFLVAEHLKRNDKILVFSDDIFALKQYARLLGVPMGPWSGVQWLSQMARHLDRVGEATDKEPAGICGGGALPGG